MTDPASLATLIEVDLERAQPDASAVMYEVMYETVEAGRRRRRRWTNPQ